MKLLFNLALIICGCMIFTASFAQNEHVHINFLGKIVDADTKEPIAAKIKYESLPYGSKIGVFSGDSFSFNMEGGNNYMLVARADGYSTYTATIKISDAVDGKIERVIELVPNGINRLIRLDKLIFALGKSEISPVSYEELNQIVAMLEESATMTIQLEGHTDFRGNAKQNLKLSEKRVESIKSYLVKQGIDRKRIATLAFGGTQPLSKDNDAASRAANRRVEVRILTN